ncbi:cellulase family glycosylhydrolase [Actinomadura barringtoniae]|uniref:Endoglucanase n=1 Tax=Actinomadura barringtoniae TaxID=1427535 RepID=A0A939PA41_9ACTN|nr:cellulase family glycosylhydrolase [Actinomadura barringtoniae]MBO2448841.1 cellulase family glycosylhydrolase [Actinomadura barringtoniae]
MRSLSPRTAAAVAVTGTLTGALCLVGSVATGTGAGNLGTGVARAAVGCKVAYTKNDWGTGFTASVTITNQGDPLNGWKLAYSYTGNQRLSSGWNGKWAQSGTAVTVTNESWNGSLATGAAVQIGANFTYSGKNDDPTAFSVNGVACNGGGGPTDPPTGPAPALKVSGNKLVDAGGKTVTLRGVNRSGGEFACVQGNGFWDGPMDAASITAIKSWKVNAVRVPLNSDCWLGLSNVPAAYRGTAYQNAVRAYVGLLLDNGLTPILDLHWTHGLWTGNDSHCQTADAECQKPMPDAQYTPEFWKQVATAFKGDTGVVFDLFNEPYPNNLQVMDYNQSWKCWRDGGADCTGLTYEAAGMQDMLDAVRGTGAANVVIAGGNSYSNDLSQWLANKPSDPTGNLAAAWHSYNFNYCKDSGCWDQQLAPVAAQVPLVAGEIGENSCGHSYTDTLMAWLDAHGASYLGWTWNTWDCSSGPSLISSYDGTPTAYGAGLRAHLLGS